MAYDSVTIIFCPYHVGLRDHRVGDGPNRIRQMGLVEKLQKLSIHVEIVEIPPVDDFEGEIGRSFEIPRRMSDAVAEVVRNNAFPIILSGNCMASVGVACGLNQTTVSMENLGFIYFDAHDDMDTPSTNTNGYFDAMGLSMLAGKSWHSLTKSIPGFVPAKYEKMVYCGLRDIDDGQKETVSLSGAEVIWGGENINFADRLENTLNERDFSPALVHLDLDVLDESVGKVNGYESPGGILEDDLVKCMDLVPRKAGPASLTVCSFSFNPNLGGGDEIAKIGVRAVVAFVKSLIATEILVVEK